MLAEMIHNKDSRRLCEDVEPNSVHAIITDPPYGLNFFGNWDKVLPPQEIWDACFDVLCPGGFALVFGHARLYHRLGCQLEDAGFIIKDCLCWGYATAMPRSLNIGRSMQCFLEEQLRLQGVEGEIEWK